MNLARLISMVIKWLLLLNCEMVNMIQIRKYLKLIKQAKYTVQLGDILEYRGGILEYRGGGWGWTQAMREGERSAKKNGGSGGDANPLAIIALMFLCWGGWQIDPLVSVFVFIVGLAIIEDLGRGKGRS